MFTPQQLEQVSFSKQAFNGYDIGDVDAFLEPLVDDYITLYKENALLKSKMRVLVNKLEEYRQNEASLKDAIVNAQKTCDLMVKEAESKCALMLSEANLAAAENNRNARELMAKENARVELARQVAATQIEELEAQLHLCIQKLEQIKQGNYPATADVEPLEAEAKFTPERTSEVVDQISKSVAQSYGPAEDAATKPTTEDPASKFSDLKFGRNYSPT